MLGIVKRLVERRRARKKRESEEALRYMVRLLIQSNSPTIIIEKGETK